MTYAKNKMFCEVDPFLPPVSAKEERDNIILFKSLSRDNPARNALASTIIRCNLRFLKSFSNKYARDWDADSNDLYSEGKLAMFEALEEFDLDKKVKFISYAVWHIRRAFNIVAKQKNIIRHNITKKTAEEMKLSEHDNPLNFKFESTDKPVGESDSMTLGDLLYDSDDNAEDSLDTSSGEDLLREALSLLEPRRKRVLELYYGVNCGTPHRLEDISTIICVSKERVRQIKDAALKDLKKALFKINPDFHGDFRW